MTRERFLEIASGVLSDDFKLIVSPETIEALADAILAEMAGDQWNAGLEAAELWHEEMAATEPLHADRCFHSQCAIDIRALRRPDAVPSRSSAPSVEDVARAMRTLSADDRATVMSNFCKHCGRDDPRCQCWNDE